MQSDPNPPSVVFLGDSVTFNWQEFDPAAWQQNPKWTNEGVIGQNSFQLLFRFQSDVVELHPQMVHLLTGTNDVYPGWVLCGGSAVFDTCDNLKAMVKSAQEAGIVPILATIPPWSCADTVKCGLAERADPSAARYERIGELNSWIEQFGIEQGLIVIDYHTALVAPDHERYITNLTVDGVHPSSLGYAVMTELVEAAIQSAQRNGK